MNGHRRPIKDSGYVCLWPVGGVVYSQFNYMNLSALRQRAPGEFVNIIRAFRGSWIFPWIISFENRWPQPAVRCILYFFNLGGLLQAFDIPGLCPMLASELHRLR